jgi:hypothetical protein
MRLPLAVLIDAENIPATLFVPLSEFVEALGEPIVWQLHGDLLPWQVPWQDIAQEHGLDVRQTFSGGKNSADIAMTTAAMDILHAGKVRGFCLVSSDSDFAPLARRLRADNVQVYGFGEAKTSRAFRASCNEFHELAQPFAGISAALKPAPAVAPPKPTVKKPAAKTVLAKPTTAAADFTPREIQSLRDWLHSVCREQGTDGRVPVATASTYIRNKDAGLAKRIGGAGKFLKNLQKLNLVNVHGVGAHRQVSVKFPALTVVG